MLFWGSHFLLDAMECINFVESTDSMESMHGFHGLMESMDSVDSVGTVESMDSMKYKESMDPMDSMHWMPSEDPWNAQIPMIPKTLGNPLLATTNKQKNYIYATISESTTFHDSTPKRVQRCCYLDCCVAAWPKMNTAGLTHVGGWGWVKPGNLSHPWVCDPVAGLHFSWLILWGQPGGGRPLWFGACGLVLAFVWIQWKVVLWDRGWSLVVPRCVAVCINMLSSDFQRIYEISLVSMVLQAPGANSRWHSFCMCFARVLRDAKVRLRRNRSDNDLKPKWDRSEFEVRPEVKSKWNRCGIEGFSKEVLKFTTKGNQKNRCFGHGGRKMFVLWNVFECGFQKAYNLQWKSNFS